MGKILARLIFDDSSVFRLLRVVSVSGFVWGVVGAMDRFFPNVLPGGAIGVVITSLFVLSGVLGLELVNAHKDLRATRVSASVDPRVAFAQSLVLYAESLSARNPPRDQALLELRRWSSRLLHLNGSHDERAKIGRLALGAAAALKDRFTEASILIDDLGWGLHVRGETEKAAEDIREGLAIIQEMPEAERSRAEVVELWIKARRHLLTIEYSTDHSIDGALREVEALKNATKNLAEPARALHRAQLSHTEAALVHQHLDRSLGPTGQVDPTGQLHKYHQIGLERSQSAESSFGELGDTERQLKALKIHVELLRHGSLSTRLHTAESRLRRLETVASRQLS